MRAPEHRRRGGIVQLVGALALPVVLTFGAPPSAPRVSAATAPAVDTLPTGAAQSVQRRPFEHRFHERLSCTRCHGNGADHRATLVRSSRDCAACHHDRTRARPCETCHSPESLAAPRTVALTLHLQTTPAPPVRDVSFRHDVHVATGTGLTCTDCHRTVVTLARDRECGSCHESHHAGRAECTSCHAAPPRGVHTASVHLGCSGGGCHAAARAPSPALSRTLCVFCHEDRRDHEPGGSCALCHRIPGAASPPASGVGSVAVR